MKDLVHIITNRLPKLLTITVALVTSYSINAQSENIATTVERKEQQSSVPETILDDRAASVNQAVANPFALSQHRLNYILPFSYVSNPNTISALGLNTENVDNLEAKYQISVKLPIYQEDKSTTGLYLGFTAVSFWQLYNSEVSKPFRETTKPPHVHHFSYSLNGLP